jgi:hypothetical protein
MGRPISKIPHLGTKFGFFTLLGGYKLVPNGKGANRVFVYVECKCGNKVYRRLSDLKIGKCLACGCMRRGNPN